MEFIIYKKELHKDVKYIREKVFVEEQGFKVEFDDLDNICDYLVLYIDNKPVGTTRIYYSDIDDSFVIGRIAVLKEYRNRHLGGDLLKKSEEYIKSLKGNLVILHAQKRAVSFYNKNGYEEYGTEDDDEGVLHIWMKKELA